MCFNLLWGRGGVENKNTLIINSKIWGASVILAAGPINDISDPVEITDTSSC
jgi:hypothetical protein